MNEIYGSRFNLQNLGTRMNLQNLQNVNYGDPRSDKSFIPRDFYGRRFVLL
jgi:hypothetical protein